MSEWAKDDDELFRDTTFDDDTDEEDNYDENNNDDHSDDDNIIHKTDKHLKYKERRKYLITKTIVLGLIWMTGGCYSGLTVATVPDLKLRIGSDYEEFSRALAAAGLGVLISAPLGGVLADRKVSLGLFISAPLGGVLADRWCASRKASLGLFMSAPLGGVLADRWVRGRDAQIITFVALAAVFTVVRPWITNLWMFGVIMWLDGFVTGIYSPGKNNMLDKLWGSGIGLPRHLMSVCSVIGTVLAPLICRPFFLTHDVSDGSVNCNDSDDSICLNGTNKWLNDTRIAKSANVDAINATFRNITNDTENVVPNGNIAGYSNEISSPIEYPYMIIVSWTIIPLVLLGIFYYRDPTSGQKYYTQNGEINNGAFKKETPTWKSIFSPKTCGQGSSVFGMGIIFVLCLYYFSLAFKSKPFYEFIMAYAVDKIGMSKADAAVMMVVGRLISIVAGIIWGTMTRFIPIQVLLIIQVFTELAIVIYFNYVEIHTSAALYGFIVAIRVLSAANWASGITWGLRYLEFSSLVYTFIELSASSAGILSTWATGYVLEYGDNEAMLRLRLGGNVVLCVVVIIMQIVASSKGEKFKKAESYEMKEMGDHSDAKTPLLFCE
ncbi:unnamed protein product [Owenia fusiformis]|uniref:Uncharacterized protein n=1 Tax=Owenia fusiformis TaxID=6347 RepID=A0A8S4Q4X7_OWEFU|nr:unnamed protein product [Owenia fusiformis]